MSTRNTFLGGAAGPEWTRLVDRLRLASELAGLLRETATGLLPMIEEALTSGTTESADAERSSNTAESRAAGADQSQVGAPAGWESLTDTEREIARLVSQAMTNRQIATRVHLSPHTVNYHLRQMYRKLEINSRVQLANLAQAHNTADSAS